MPSSLLVCVALSCLIVAGAATELPSIHVDEPGYTDKLGSAGMEHDLVGNAVRFMLNATLTLNVTRSIADILNDHGANVTFFEADLEPTQLGRILAAEVFLITLVGVVAGGIMGCIMGCGCGVSVTDWIHGEKLKKHDATVTSLLGMVNESKERQTRVARVLGQTLSNLARRADTSTPQGRAVQKAAELGAFHDVTLVGQLLGGDAEQAARQLAALSGPELIHAAQHDFDLDATHPRPAVQALAQWDIDVNNLCTTYNGFINWREAWPALDWFPHAASALAAIGVPVYFVESRYMTVPIVCCCAGFAIYQLQKDWTTLMTRHPFWRACLDRTTFRLDNTVGLSDERKNAYREEYTSIVNFAGSSARDRQRQLAQRKQNYVEERLLAIKSRQEAVMLAAQR